MLLTLTSAVIVHAQPAVDAFNPGANATVNAIAVQSDGKILVGGDFTRLGGGGTGTTTRNYIGRLNADGSLDTSFNPGANDRVRALAVQADGKILVGGDFTGLVGSPDTGFSPRNGLGRLHADGSLDTTFNPAVGGGTTVFALVAQADGNILVGGSNFVAQLTATGARRIYRSTNAQVFTVAAQTDGKILFGGDFIYLDGFRIPCNRLGRLNVDGSLDPTIDDNALNGRVSALAVQADGKIVIGGDFTALGFGGGLVGSATRNNLGRLNANGSLDTSFNPGASGQSVGNIGTIVVQPDGKILLGGWLNALGGGTGTTTRRFIGRLNSDGSVDMSFNPSAGLPVAAIAVQADGKIVVGGSFTRLGGNGIVNTTPRNYIGRFAAEPAAPSVATQPSNQTVTAGATVTLSAGASGSPSPTMQWQVSRDNGATFTNINGATAGTYSFVASAADNSAQFRVVFTNSLGTATSNAALVSFSNPGRLINLSVLAPISTPGDSFSLGYVVSGASATNPKPLVIRVAGSSLGALGYPGTLADPKLELFAGSTKTTENDNWGGSATTTTAMASVGAFAFTGPTSLDAAVVANITSSDNSVRITAGASAPNATGAVIAEVYDATPAANFTGSTPRLVNFSVLKNVGTSVTLGFVIGGGSSKTVLVRAIGPSLGVAPFNLAAVMVDPKIELFADGGRSLGTNDNWGGTAALTAAFGQTGAFTVPANSRDAALVATLSPGNYSAVVTPVAGSASGTAILEVYEVP